MIFDPSAYQVGLELIGDWLTPIEARAIAAEALGVENWKAEDALMECIKGAQIELCASTSSAATGSGKPAQTGSRLVPAEYWHLVQRSSTEFMQARAVFILRSGRSAYDPEVTLRCFRLVLNPFHVRREFPRPRKTEVAPVSGEPAPDEVRNPGGRPKATWREPVLIEIAGQLLDGDLKPKKLADVEKAAKEWLGKQGEYPGDRTVREVVRPLYLRFLQEGKKP